MKEEARILSKALEIKADNLNRDFQKQYQGQLKENKATTPTVSRGALVSQATNNEKL